MNFSSMDYFVMVAQEQSFTRAAERLHITQQTLSAHIAGLEKEVGSRLFVRTVPLTLTYAGQVFLEYAIDFRRKYQSLEQEMSDIARNQKGLLRIGTTVARGQAIMPGLIHAFHQRRPQIAVKLVEAENDQLCRYLLDGEIDLAVANFPPRVPGVEVRDFSQEEIVLWAARSLLDRLYGPEAPRLAERVAKEGLGVLEACPFLLNSPRNIAGRVGRDLLAQAGVVPTVAVESSNVETLWPLCLLGEGALFASLSWEQTDELELFHLGEEACYMVRFAYLKQERLWSVLEDFMEVALKKDRQRT